MRTTGRSPEHSRARRLLCAPRAGGNRFRSQDMARCTRCSRRPCTEPGIPDVPVVRSCAHCRFLLPCRRLSRDRRAADGLALAECRCLRARLSLITHKHLLTFHRYTPHRRRTSASQREAHGKRGRRRGMRRAHDGCHGRAGRPQQHRPTEADAACRSRCRGWVTPRVPRDWLHALVLALSLLTGPRIMVETIDDAGGTMSASDMGILFVSPDLVR